MTPRLDTLPEPQRLLWESLRPSISLGMVLYGGTAVALRLGHRISVDFDFFSEKPLQKEKIWSTFAFMKSVDVLQDQPDTLTVLAKSTVAPGSVVKISFFGAIKFGRVGIPDTTLDGIIQIASLDDLMATKLKVLLQRVEAKDYRDIAAMIRAGVSLAKGFASASEMYGMSFQPMEGLKALTYFKGGDLNTLSAEDRETLVQAARDIHTLPQSAILDYKLAL